MGSKHKHLDQEGQIIKLQNKSVRLELLSDAADGQAATINHANLELVQATVAVRPHALAMFTKAVPDAKPTDASGAQASTAASGAEASTAASGAEASAAASGAKKSTKQSALDLYGEDATSYDSDV